jgi:hypothetical protein
METLSVRIKFREHEFEANGPAELVQAELLAFRKLVGTTDGTAPIPTPDSSAPDLVRSILEVDGRVIFLKVKTQSLDDAVLALLWGHKHFRSKTAVNGGEVMDGLRVSGLNVSRVDFLLRQHVAQGNVTISGTHRAKRYQLTKSGLARAEQVVNALLNPPRKTTT